MTATIRETAVAARKAGIVVLPAAADGSKRPAFSWKEYEQRQPTDAELSRWFPKEGGPQGLGFICGAVSGGLELLEFEDKQTVVEFQMLAQAAGLDDLVKKVSLGYCEETPGGGVHWLYRVAEPLPNTKLAAKPCPGAPECDKHEAGKAHVLIETRGEGGWVVVAPSNGTTHPSGRPYVLRAGGLPIHTMLTIEERDELFALALSLDEMPRQTPQEATERVSQGDEGQRPGDLYNASVSWAQVLEPFGWKFVHQHGGESYWRRPGARTRGIDATTNYKGSDLFYVFSSSVEGFEIEQGYSKWRAYAILAHGGDFGAAARDLVSQGYKSAGEITVLSGPRLEARETPPEARQRRGYCFEHIFPEGHFIRQYVEYASALTDAPWEYHEALAASALGMVVPGVRARFSAWPRGLATNLYVALCGPSTTYRKSTAADILKALLARVDDGAVFPDKFSTEALLEQLAMRSKRPALWFPDEIGKVLEDMERKPLLEDALLTLYGSPESYDYARHSKRIKGGLTVEDHDRIEHPHWGIIGNTTESIFDGISSRMVQSGLLPRFAYVWPEEKPPRMGLRLTTPDMKQEADALTQYLRDLYAWANVADGNVRVEFSEEAIEIIDAYMMEIENTSQTIVARLPAMAIKLAMISALGEVIPQVPALLVMPVDAERAVALAHRWQDSALRFGSEIGGFSKLERTQQQRLDKAVYYLRKQGGRATRGEVMRHLRIVADDLDKLQRTLVESELIALETPVSSGGRPATYWVLT